MSAVSSVGSTPARTVAIWSGDVHVIAATSCPPNAGFHATSRWFVDLEIDRVAGEARVEARRETRRDLAAPRRRRREDRPRVVGCDERDRRVRDVLFDVLADEVHHLVGAPRNERAIVGRFDGDGEHVSGECCAAPSSSRVTCWRSGSHNTIVQLDRRPRHRDRCSRLVVDAVRLGCRSSSTTLAHLLVERCVGPAFVGPRDFGDLDLADVRSRLRACLQRSDIGVARAAGCERPGTSARSAGSTLAGSQSRSAHDRIAGSSSSACIHPSSCSQRALTCVPSIARWRTPVRNGRSSSSAIWRADLAGVGVDRVAAGEDQIERALAFEHLRQHRRGREGVGARVDGIGDEHAVDVDVAGEAPRDRFAQRVFGGRRAERETR